MSLYTLVGGLIILALGAWIAWSFWIVSGIETPVYTVSKSALGYELRQYEPYIVAEAEVPAEGLRDGLNSGFMIVADYIFGNNETETKLAMTAPVISDNRSGQEIAMTAPVLSETSNSRRTVSFVMPHTYTLETLPKPRDERVSLHTVAGRTLAVSTFYGWATEARLSAAEGALLSALERDELVVVGTPIYAGYNPPFSFPLMQRHEVMVEVKK